MQLSGLSSETSCTVLLADDQILVRAGISALLDTLGYRVVAECADGAQTLDAAERVRPDIVLLDIVMPGMSGLEVARTLRERYPAIKILFLSGVEDEQTISAAVAVGVDGYLLKDFALAELDAALTTVRRGEIFFSPRVSHVLLTRMHRQHDRAEAQVALTGRQTQILALIAQGHTTKEIARILGISPKTVDFHRTQIMERLDMHDIASLTRYAIEHGIEV